MDELFGNNPSGKFIEGKELTLDDVGSKVTYVPRHANGDAAHKDSEGGTIKRWTEHGVFVNFVRNTCRTNFSDLVWG